MAVVVNDGLAADALGLDARPHGAERPGADIQRDDPVGARLDRPERRGRREGCRGRARNVRRSLAPRLLGGGGTARQGHQRGAGATKEMTALHVHPHGL